VRLNPFRHQLASTSPVRAADVWRALLSAQREPTGEATQQLVAELLRRHRVADAHLTGSGTEALVLALRLAGRLTGGEPTVVLPAFSCFDVAAAAVRCGRPVAFYDLDPGTLGPELDSLATVLRNSPGPHVVVIQTLFGIPVDWNEVDPVLAAAGAFPIEDAAQGHGARWNGAALGGHGRLGVVSFGRGKGWTGGEGGALLVRDADDRRRICDVELQNRSGALPWMAKTLAHAALGRPALYGLPRAVPGLALGETVYRDAREPSAMGAHAAALALRSVHAADAWREARVQAADRYRNLLAAQGRSPGVVPPHQATPGFIRYPIRLPHGLASFTDAAEAVRLGAASSYPIALPELEQLRPLLAHSAPTPRYPGARALVRELVTLPAHRWVREEEQGRLVSLLKA